MKIMVSAGEVSGDMHGASLVHELKKLKPDLRFFGMGSENLLAEGVEVKLDITRRGTIGIFEALPNAIPIFFAYRKLVGLLKKEKPDLLLLIDSQGINLPLARAAKKLGIRTVYYIAPQEWLWGTARGIKKVARTIDLIVAIFEKEAETYKAAGGNVFFAGHPLMDIVSSSLSPFAARQQFLGTQEGPVIAICPGSRTQEIKGLFPILLKAAELIQKEMPHAHFLVPAASTNMLQKIFDLIRDFRPKAIVGHTYDILAASDLAICTSGTINLEASILGTPSIMTYKLSPLTYWVGKNILKLGEKLPYFSMPNILLGEKVIPELLMKDANPERIAQESLAILQDPTRQQKMKASFNLLKNKLGASDVIARCAQAILASSLYCRN